MTLFTFDYGGCYENFVWDKSPEETIAKSIELQWKSAQFASKGVSLEWLSEQYASCGLSLEWASENYIWKALSLEWSSGGMMDSGITLEWCSGGYTRSPLGLEWSSGGPINSSFSLQWASYQWALKAMSLEWKAYQFAAKSIELRWKSGNMITKPLDLQWKSSQWASKEIELKWKAEQFAALALSLEWRSENYISDPISLKWKSENYTSDTLSLKWKSSQWASKEIELKWLSEQWASLGLSLEWKGEQFASKPIGLEWKSQNYIWKAISLKWRCGDLVAKGLSLKWKSSQWASKEIELQWLSEQWASKELSLRWCQWASEELSLLVSQQDPLTLKKVDWIEVETAQGEALNPLIISGRITLKYGAISEAKINLSEPIPEDCLCTIIIARDQKRFNGISRKCSWQQDGSYLAEIYGYLEIAKPNPPKGGLYLGKYIWQNVTLNQLLASNEPSLNGGFPGLVYVMNSCIYYELWDIESEPKGVWKWIYEGIPYTISKVYSDGTALTSRASLVELETGTNSGYYHDSNNKTLYIRLADQTSPYYHVISVPNIWDGIVPIRLGVVAATTPTILYWETANGDIPYEVLNTFCMCAGLEFEESFRNDTCYIDIAEKCGRGSATEPAGYYEAGRNITKVVELDLVDARYQVTGVIMQGYSQGSAGIIAGETINQGRGGRFVRLDDATQHSESMAEAYVSNYLDKKRLPAHRVVFEAPLVEKGILDKRNLGDDIYIKIPGANNFENHLRIQQIDIYLGNGTRQAITAGDELVTPESILQAIKSANEKFRRHQEDATEAFDWSWNENIDHNLDLTNTFDISADVLAVQKTELTINIDRTRVDVTESISSRGGSGGDGAGGSTGTAPATTHKHQTLTLKAIKSADKVAAITGLTKTTAKAIQTIDVDSITVLTALGTPTTAKAIQTIDVDSISVLTGLGTPTTAKAIQTIDVDSITVLTGLGTPTTAKAIQTIDVDSITALTSLGTPSTNTAIHSLTTTTASALTAVGTAALSNVIATLKSDCCTAVHCGKRWALSTSDAANLKAVVTGLTSPLMQAMIKTVVANPSGGTVTFLTGYPSPATATIKSVKVTQDPAHSITAITGYPSPATSTIKSVKVTQDPAHSITAITGYPSPATATIKSVKVTQDPAHSITAITGYPSPATATIKSVKVTQAPAHSIDAVITITTTTTDCSPKDHEHEIQAFYTEADNDLGNSQDIKDGFVSWTVNHNNEEVPVIIKVGNYNYGSDPEMYMHTYINDVEVVGSPFVMSSSEKTAGPIILNPDYVNKAGKYTLKLKLTNKTTPGAACRCRLTANVRGRFFCDTIFSKGA